MTRVTRRYRFAASHRLHSAERSEAENSELYGKCNNPYGHGHDYILEVGVRGQIDGSTGRVVNPLALDEFVRAAVLNVFDHKDMNRDVDSFRDVVPTTENLSLDVERRLREGWCFAAAELDRIKLQETKRNSFELKGL
ncbi:MAG TPA: 6-carboxytetrahydropterin synthase [Bryobacteraceae bacterium]|nr:6-carboxytetrahydropterin synthase [Bryobacteraceae bacterium]